DLVARLNSLKWNLVWRPLAETICRSVTIRRLGDETSVVRMFAASSVVESKDVGGQGTLLLKEEGDLDCVKALLVNQTAVEFGVKDGFLRVWLTALPAETATVRVVYRNDLPTIAGLDRFSARIEVAAKRYLSEFRDNYLSRSDFLYRSAYRLRQLVK